MITVIIAALGYFVDVFDIVLFSMLRVESLKAIGVGEEDILRVGMRLQNIQLFGMLVGGIIWGVLGDKVGRVQVLFGTILLYSVANIANAYVTTVESYEICRFIAGFGLAGEVGAAITIVSEIMSRMKRGIGTSIICTAGTAGAVVASLTVRYMSWQNAYIVGGALGLVLLFLRYNVRESEMFQNTKKLEHVKRGNFLSLLSTPKNFFRFFTGILSCLPVFFTLYTLVTFSPEFGKAVGIPDISVSTASLYFLISLTIGDLICGLTSQYCKNRKKVLLAYMLGAFIFTLLLLTAHDTTSQYFYNLCIPAGFFMGHWSVYATTIAEQYGTNIRSTVTSMTLNFVRASNIVINFSILSLKPSLGFVMAMQVVGVCCYLISFYSVTRLKETFGTDLDYNEI